MCLHGRCGHTGGVVWFWLPAFATFTPSARGLQRFRETESAALEVGVRERWSAVAHPLAAAAAPRQALRVGMWFVGLPRAMKQITVEDVEVGTRLSLRTESWSCDTRYVTRPGVTHSGVTVHVASKASHAHRELHLPTRQWHQPSCVRTVVRVTQASVQEKSLWDWDM